MDSKQPDPLYIFRKNMAQINCLHICSRENNELLYVGTSEGIIHIWDLKIRREIKNLKVCDKECITICHIKDLFIVQERGNCLKFWKVDNLEWQLFSAIQTDYYGFCKIFVCNEQIYCPGNNGILLVYQGCNSTPICKCTKRSDNNKLGEVMCIKYLQNRNSLLAAYECGILILWTLKESQAKIEFEKKFNDDTPMCLDVCELTAEGVLGSSGDYLTKFRVENDLCEIRSTSITNPGIASLAISKDGKLVVAGCWDGKIRYFSMKHLKLLAVLDHHNGCAIQYVMFTEDDLITYSTGTLFAAGNDGRISMWDIYTKRNKKS